ncbi:unnamed protein product [Leptosia nina]|uniref:Uncharacterized protein n=1 Tax=Leptosia nina TaxID=320188 RepID=A0AAV1JCV0_9NEOP
MNKTCRLCLNESSEYMHEICEDSALTKNIFKCFSFELKFKDNLPKNVCSSCYNKIEDMILFRERIIENEKKLLSKLQSLDHNHLTESKKEVEYNSESNQSSLSTYHTYVKNLNPATASWVCKVKKDLVDIQKVLNGQKLMCLMCFNIFGSQKRLLDHYFNEEVKTSVAEFILENSDGKFVCQKCKRQFKTRNKIVQHICSEHDEKMSFSCKLCGKMYKEVMALINHGQRSHGLKEFFCSFKCGYSTGYINGLKNHEKSHTREYKYTCKECNKGFNVRTWYKEHQNIHKGIKEFKCNICGAAFHVKRYLSTHKTSVHPESLTKKRYACPFCALEYASRGQLNLHLKEHGVTNDCLCDQCGKVLKDVKRLAAHKLQHSTARPYMCGKCNKTFAKKYNWKIHQNTHTNEKLYKCLICEKAFSQQSALNRHTVSKHPKDEPLQRTRNQLRNVNDLQPPKE